MAVGGFSGNAWDLRDMHGNVAEWCRPMSAATAAAPKTYVLRGGSWADPPWTCRGAARTVVAVDDSEFQPAGTCGFRIVVDIHNWQPDPRDSETPPPAAP